MVRALAVVGAMLVVVGLLLATPARDILPVDLFPMAAQWLSGADAPAYVKIVPASEDDGLSLKGAALLATGMLTLVISWRLRERRQEHE